MTNNSFPIAALLIFFVLLGGGWYLFNNNTATLPQTEGEDQIPSPVVEETNEDPTPSVSTKPSQPPPVYKTALTTQFWVGEQSDESNGFIPNHESYWDDAWMTHFGGVDDPECRNGYYPCGFTPRENPFYVALPYGEYIEGSSERKPSIASIPWSSSDSKPLLKNRWVEVVYNGKSCYGQWQDVGPFLTDDFMYVFGDSAPSNTFGVGAGLDISPALWDCLGLTTNEITQWRFVDASKVPDGPWTNIITTRGISWE